MIWLINSLHLQVAIDSATPVDDAGPSGNFMMNSMESFGGYGGPVRSYGRMYGSLDFDDVSIYILMILWSIYKGNGIWTICQEFELLSKYLNMKYFSFLSLKTPLISGCIGAPRM